MGKIVYRPLKVAQKLLTIKIARSIIKIGKSGNIMTKSTIKQNSQAWLELRKKRLCSSEIFGLIHYYITKEELQNVGINSDDFADTPYVTAFELFHKFKNPNLYIERPFTKEKQAYSKRIEQFALHYLSKIENKYNSTYEKGAVYTDEKLMATLDIEAEANSKDIIQDSNGFNISLKDTPRHLIGVKDCVSYVMKSKEYAEKGVDWKFIFKTQFAMMLAKYEWCRIVIFSLVNDNQFERGLICGLSKDKSFNYINDNVNIYNYIYKARPEYQYLIKTALKRFEYDLAANNPPKINNISNHKTIYNVIKQQANILGTTYSSIESNEFDKYFALNQKSKDIEYDLKSMKKRIVEIMLNSGKSKLVGSKGHFSLSQRSLTAAIKKS